MQKKIFLFAFLGLLILVGPCRSSWDRWFYTPANTPCMPISYPDRARFDLESYEVYTFETAASYTDVVDFYRTHLKFDPPLRTDYDDTVEWKEYPIRDIGILFECYANLTDYTVESGCIFVRNEDGTGIVDVSWAYYDDFVASCYRLPKIEPEDYQETP
jgi:hypothetical protein